MAYEVWKLYRRFDMLTDRDLRARLDQGDEVGRLEGSAPTLDELKGHIRGVPTNRPMGEYLETIQAEIATKGLWKYRRGTAIYYRMEANSDAR